MIRRDRASPCQYQSRHLLAYGRPGFRCQIRAVTTQIYHAGAIISGKIVRRQFSPLANLAMIPPNSRQTRRLPDGPRAAVYLLVLDAKEEINRVEGLCQNLELVTLRASFFQQVAGRLLTGKQENPAVGE